MGCWVPSNRTQYTQVVRWCDDIKEPNETRYTHCIHLNVLYKFEDHAAQFFQDRASIVYLSRMLLLSKSLLSLKERQLKGKQWVENGGSSEIESILLVLSSGFTFFERAGSPNSTL